MIPIFWILGPLIRIPIWLACEALGLAYLIMNCMLAAVYAILKTVYFVIRNRTSI